MCDTSTCGTPAPDGGEGLDTARSSPLMGKKSGRKRTLGRSLAGPKRLRLLRLSREFSQVPRGIDSLKREARRLVCLLGLVLRPARMRLAYRLSLKPGELPCRWPECRARWPNRCRAEGLVFSTGFSRILRLLTLLWLRLSLRVLPVDTARLEEASRAFKEAREALSSLIQVRSSQRPLVSRLNDPFGIWEKAKTLPPEFQPLDLSTPQSDSQSQIPLQLWSEESTIYESEVVDLGAEETLPEHPSDREV